MPCKFTGQINIRFMKFIKIAVLALLINVKIIPYSFAANQNKSLEELVASQQNEQQYEQSQISKKEKKLNELRCELELLQLELEKQLSSLRAEITKIKLEKEAENLAWELQLDKERILHEKKMLAMRKETQELKSETELLNAKIEKMVTDLKLLTQEHEKKLCFMQLEAEKINLELKTSALKQVKDTYIEKNATYLVEPFDKASGKLTISDRKIEFHGIVNDAKAHYVVDRINYYNNKNTELPIFLIIENSPGGSASAGEQILRTMDASKAPVYVVVKGFAGSMAAVITTLAKKSFIYENASMLHHQPSTFVGGNVREVKHLAERLEEFWNRLGGRVAKKMGISLVEFNKKLYDNSGSGDWHLYGDKAVKIKWADYVIKGIVDTSILHLPKEEAYNQSDYWNKFWGNNLKTEEKGNKSDKITLSKLTYPDFYFMYDPYNQYCIE
jgi:ATP-dependent Clp protease protease subunit